MKKTINLIFLLSVPVFLYCQNPVLHWRFANPEVFTIDTNHFFQFDVELSCSMGGTYMSDNQQYIRYDTNAFGSNVVSGGNINFVFLEIAGGPPYNNFTFGIVDNLPDRFAMYVSFYITSPYPFFPYNIPAFPDFAGLCRYTVKIKDPYYQTGLEFVPESGGVGLMNGGQYYIDATHPYATKYGIPPDYAGIYENDLVNYHFPINISLNIRVIAEGAYNSTTQSMRTNLLSNGLLPLSQPYAPALPYYSNMSPGWYYTGAETVATIPESITDWVIIEVRDAPDGPSATSATTVARQACFLRNDGMVTNLSGDTAFFFNNEINEGLFIVVWHRNHLPVMNPEPLQAANADNLLFIHDFTSGPLQAFGGILAQHEVEPGVWAMMAADGNADGQVGNPDKNEVWAVDAAQSGYLGGDFNLDGHCNSQDKVDFLQVNSGNGSQVPQ